MANVARWGLAGLLACCLALGTTGCTSDGSEDTAKTTTTRPVASPSGPCVDLDQDAIDTAIGGPAVITVEAPERCAIARTGTVVSVEVEQIAADATPEDFDAATRRSGPSVEELSDWPSQPVDDVADQAKFLVDPQSGGTYGELYALDGERLVRVSVTTPPDYRREPAKIAAAVASAVLEGR